MSLRVLQSAGGDKVLMKCIKGNSLDEVSPAGRASCGTAEHRAHSFTPFQPQPAGEAPRIITHKNTHLEP